MKELLRITMSEDQVEQACIEYAKARSSLNEPHSISTRFLPPPEGGVEVVFTKKRVRAKTSSKP